MCAANVRAHRRAGNRRALDTQSPLDQNKAWFFICLGVIMVIDCGARIHLIAICGTAMGALAGMLRERGFRLAAAFVEHREVDQRIDVLTLPRTAIQRNNGQQFVLVSRAGAWVNQEIEAGWRTDRAIEIRDGLAEGETVQLNKE